MFDNLYKTLRAVLFQRWGERVQGILAGGKQVESSGMTVPDAYAEGYRVAYFDAVADLVEAGFIKESTPPTKLRVFPLMQASDVIH
jgi:hypothetical protein